MITINSLCYTNLLNDEFLGLEQKISSFTTGLVNEKIKNSVTKFNAAVTQLANHLALGGGETVGHAASRLNDDRLTAYKSLRQMVKQVSSLTNPASAALGATYCSYFDGHEYIRNLTQDAITGIINAVITVFRTHSTEELTGLGVESWVANLESAEAAYEAAAKARGEEADSHVNKLTLKYREECTQYFEILVNDARSLAIHEDDAACRDFIEQVNGEIALRKEKLKVRKNAAKKKNEESAKTDSTKTEATAETAKVEAVTESTTVESTNTETIKAVA